MDETLERGRVSRLSGGRRPLIEKDPSILAVLERLVGQHDRDDPESPLRWTVIILRNLDDALRGIRHSAHFTTVAKLLRGLGYSLQANAKTREGASHPDRDAQVRHISETVQAALEAGVSAISVDAKKRELFGDFKDRGRELEPKGRPVEVRSHDFKDKKLGHAIPYGILDLTHDEGWVSVGIDSNTAQFAAASIQDWWEHLGSERYPQATSLTITADLRQLKRKPPAPGRPSCSSSPTTPASRSRSAASARHQGVAGGSRTPGLSEPCVSLSTHTALHYPASWPHQRQWANSPGSRRCDARQEPRRPLVWPLQPLVFPHGPSNEIVVDVPERRIQPGLVEPSVVVDPAAHDRVEHPCQVREGLVRSIGEAASDGSLPYRLPGVVAHRRG